MSQTQNKLLEKLPEVSLYLLVSLIPLWFLPFTQDVLAYQKQFLLLLLVFLGLIAWLGQSIAKGEMSVRVSWLYIPVGVFLGAMGASTFFSLSRYASFWGWPLDVADSFLTFLILALLGFLVINTVLSSKRLFSVLLTFLISSVLAGIIALLQMYKVFLLPFGLTKAIDFNTLGSSVNGVAVLAAVLLPLSLVLAFVSKMTLRLILWAIVGILVLIVIFINFSSAWLVLVTGLLLLLAFGLWNLRKRKEFGWVSFPMALLIIALFFLVFKVSLPGTPQTPAEISLSRSAETAIAKGVWQGRAMVLGSGPGTFAFDYSKFRSPLFSQTVFWQTRFSSGASEFFDFSVTKGILGLIALLALAGLAVFSGVKKLVAGSTDSFAWMINLGVLASFTGLAAAFFLYPANFILWFVFWLLLGALVAGSSSDPKKIPLASPSILAVGLSFSFLIILIFGLGLLFIAGQKYFAQVRYFQGLKLEQAGQTDKAIEKIAAAARNNALADVYWRDLAQLYLIRAGQSKSPDDVSAAIEAARRAVGANPKNVANWNVQGFVYRNLIGFAGADAFAAASYEKAIELEPNSPFSWTELGRVYISTSKPDLALEKLDKAIELKPDYAPARYLMATAYSQQGKSQEAIQKLEETQVLAPNDLGLAFQLGVAYWQKPDFNKAQLEFERVKILDANYANGRYMLGLVYDKKGLKTKALEEFAKVLELNPENAEVQKILANLNAGKAALTGIAPSQPPVPENPPEIQKKK